MREVIGVRFKKVSRIYYFDPAGQKINTGEHVIVETVRGIEMGMVAISNKMISEEEFNKPIKTIMRVATKEDIEATANNAQKEKEAFEICAQKIKEHNIDMKLVDTELTFDQNKILFYFTADGRVDFRDLVKDLVAIFRVRIELRQIGVRDEAKLINSVGMCGRGLCCASFLGDFQPVSIKMAKDQNLSLNPTKISGTCGRLMCCLKYEEETYNHLNTLLPNEGDKVKTPDGNGEVLSVSTLRQLVKVAVRKREKDVPQVNVYDVADIKILSHKKNDDEKINVEDLKDLLD
ncbi:MAG: stage 0 sporulation family protein [Defluviitaleaceae bacterium]|nr:stage 0 sporulation family protein [Defluviitaleaceae bacterium]